MHIVTLCQARAMRYAIHGDVSYYYYMYYCYYYKYKCTTTTTARRLRMSRSSCFSRPSSGLYTRACTRGCGKVDLARRVSVLGLGLGWGLGGPALSPSTAHLTEDVSSRRRCTTPVL